jgi:hydrogenase maturation protease
LTGSHVLVIGVGNEIRADDAVGLHVCRVLKGRLPDHCNVVENSGDGANLMELWKNSQVTILVDAVRSGTEPGQVHRYEAHQRPLPATLFQNSTHAFGVPQAIELARAMNQLPQTLIVYGIEGACFDEGVGISPVVELAGRKVAESIVHSISHNFSIEL